MISAIWSVILAAISIAAIPSSASTCGSCPRQATVTYFREDSRFIYGACGYGNMAPEMSHNYLAGAVDYIFNGGVGCGECYRIKCTDDSKNCSLEGTTFMVTDLNNDGSKDFVLSRKAFDAMVNNDPKSVRALERDGSVNVEYKRIKCSYKKNLALLVHKLSNPNFLAVAVLYQGGQTKIVGINVYPAVGSSTDWKGATMGPNFGAVWSADIEAGVDLRFVFIVKSGFNRKSYESKRVMPADWEIDGVYGMGINITNTAQDTCC